MELPVNNPKTRIAVHNLVRNCPWINWSTRTWVKLIVSTIATFPKWVSFRTYYASQGLKREAMGLCEASGFRCLHRGPQLSNPYPRCSQTDELHEIHSSCRDYHENKCHSDSGKPQKENTADNIGNHHRARMTQTTYRFYIWRQKPRNKIGTLHRQQTALFNAHHPWPSTLVFRFLLLHWRTALPSINLWNQWLIRNWYTQTVNSCHLWDVVRSWSQLRAFSVHRVSPPSLRLLCFYCEPLQVDENVYACPDSQACKKKFRHGTHPKGRQR